MGARDLKDWQWAWGAWFSGVAVMSAAVVYLSIGDLPMVLWFSGMGVVGAVGAAVAFTPIRTKSAPGTEHPYCTGCGDRHDGPRCY
jgi:hypothetical protein